MSEIRDKHMYHGAVIWQIADHPQFTAINRVDLFTRGGDASYSAYIVETRGRKKTGVYIKTAGNTIEATEPSPPPNDFESYYQFGFDQSAKAHLSALDNKCHKTFVLMVCERDKFVCCLAYADFLSIVQQQKKHLRSGETSATTLRVNLETRKGFRVNMITPHTRSGKYLLDNPKEIPRSDFPDKIFE